MQLLVLDKKFSPLGAVGDFISLMWNRKYYEPGDFELHTIKTYWGLIESGVYIWKNDADELGVIEKVSYQKNARGMTTIICKGHFAEVLLNKTFCTGVHGTFGLFDSIYRLSGDLIKEKNRSVREGDPSWVISSTYTDDRKIALDFSSSSATLGAKLYSLERVLEASHSVIYDYALNQVRVVLWKGLNRSANQSQSPWAVFSDAFENIKNYQYQRDISDFMDTAMVFGEGEGEARERGKVYERHPLYSGYCLVVDARDLQKTYKDHAGIERTYSDADYVMALEQRGREKLARYPVMESISCEVDPTANLRYKNDYDLGDVCTIRLSEIGVETDMRLTEIAEIYENGRLKLSIEFGDCTTTDLRKIIRREL